MTDLLWQPTMDEVLAPGRQSEHGSRPSWRDNRRHLDGGAWVDFQPGWLKDSDGMAERLRRLVPWRTEERRMYDVVRAVPRLVAWYPDPRRVPDPRVGQAAARLSQHYGEQGWDPFETAGLCLYRDGSDSVAWHGDRIGRGRDGDTVIAIVSLGTPRQLWLRPRGGGPSVRYTLGNGDLIVMGGSCQRTWDHCVPKSNGVIGSRISIQFRQAGVA